MSAEEVIDLFAPSADSVNAVTEWLKSAGFSADRISQSANKQWMQFDATVAEAEDLLFTEFYVYEHRHTGTQNIACDEYHVPAHIREHIDYITPGIKMRVDASKARKTKREYQARQLRKRGVSSMNTGAIPLPIGNARLPTLPPLNSSVCNKYVTNQCVRSKCPVDEPVPRLSSNAAIDQYRVPKGSKAAEGNELGIFESLNDHYSKADLDVYWSNLFP